MIYRHDGQNLVLGPKPDLEGKNLTHLKDANGVFFVKRLIEGGVSGVGFVFYQFPRAGSDTPAPKLAYTRNVEPWQWVVGTGVYVDDLDAIFWAAYGPLRV